MTPVQAPERASALRSFVASIAYKPGWAFKLGGPGGRFVCAFVKAPDSLHPNVERVTQHMFEVPDDLDGADVPALARWLFERILDAERHEAAEFLQVDGHRPFFPHHGDEGSPYESVERW